MYSSTLFSQVYIIILEQNNPKSDFLLTLIKGTNIWEDSSSVLKYRNV